MFRFANRSKGFTLIEVMVALAIMAVVLTSSLRLINAYKTNTAVTNQQYNIVQLATAIKNNAKLIMDASMTVCTNITSAYANDGWGWRHPSCINTSPFPVYTISTNVLTYNIDTANFAGTVNSIISNTSNYCTYTGQTATSVAFNCAGLNVTGIQYQTSTGPTSNAYANTVNIFTTPHNAGSNGDFLNFLNFPSAIYIQYNKVLSNVGSTISCNDMLNGSDPSIYANRLDMTDLYLDRVKKTRDNLIALDAALRGYDVSNRVAEFENVPPNGLSTQDSIFVPWVWQALATNQANTLTLCNNATTCSSIVSGTQWATAAQVSNFASTWLLITTNLMSSNLTYAADAFGNPLRLIPINNGCTGNVSGCVPSTNVPPLPQSGYLAALAAAGYGAMPPYNSLIVSPLCTAAGTAYPDFCRWTVVGPS